MLGIRMAVVVISLGIAAGLCGCSSKAAAKPTEAPPLPVETSIKPGKGLFRSHEFRSSLQSLPGWDRVMAAAQSQVESMAACDASSRECPPAAFSWQKIIEQASRLGAYAQMKKVNAYFNRWPYRLDIDVYGVSDYWATPKEFLQLSGDCEDFSIVKYYALRTLGFDPHNLRIVLLRDTIRNISHAVLAVRLGDETYIMDNMSDLVLPHLKYEHYVPQYSVNEFYRWAHISADLLQTGSP